MNENDIVGVLLKTHGGEPLLFSTALTQGAALSTPVKWDVTYEGQDIVVGLPEPPSRSLFVQEGVYRVFAYVVTEDGESVGENGCVYKVFGETDADGIAVFEIKVDKSWLQGKQSATFDVFVLEGCSKETVVIMPNGRYCTDKNTSKLFRMGKDRGMLLLSRPKPEIKAGQSKTMVQEVKDEEHKCPRCDQDITLDEIKQICVDDKGNCLIKDTTMITAALPYLNQYRKKVGINTCVSKAHFLAQIAQETKFHKLQEDFTYSVAALKKKKAFQTEEGCKHAEEWGYTDPKNKYVSPNNQKNIANWAYANRYKNGDFASGDGWRYSGKGFKQITWKENYQTLSNYFNKNMKIGTEPDTDWEKIPTNLSTNPKDAICSALAFWGYKGLSAIARKADDATVEQVSFIVNGGENGLSERKRYFKKAVETLKVDDCIGSNLSKKKEENSEIIIIINRLKQIISDDKTIGTLDVDNGAITGYSLERNGIPASKEIISMSKKRIRAGTYKFEVNDYVDAKHKYRIGTTLRLFNVPGRTGILLHHGNDAVIWSEGCILGNPNEPLTKANNTNEASKEFVKQIALYVKEREKTIKKEYGLKTVKKTIIIKQDNEEIVK